MVKYLSIIGTRPQYVKVLDNLKNHIIADTGQHYDDDMSHVFLNQLHIKPKYQLDETELGKMYDKLTDIIIEEAPEIVLVYGDTRSTLAGALAAKFANRTLAHIEAGMRSGDMTQPEELIRILVDRMSDFRFCANEYARVNLLHEGLTKNNHVVGDAMWDALNKVLPIPKTKDCGTYNLVTIHRPSNTESKTALQDIMDALEQSKEQFKFPCHPGTRRAFKKFGIKIPHNVQMMHPQGYKEMIQLETNAKKILTDSGGVQREGCWFHKPVIVLRWETEWKELVDTGWACLVGSSKPLILNALKNHNPTPNMNSLDFVPPFGAKEKIKQLLE